MKRILQQLFLNTLQDIAPQKVLPQHMQLKGHWLCIENDVVDLDTCDQIVIAAIGKAASTMTAALVDLLQPRKVRGMTVNPAGTATAITGIDTFCGGHPYPNCNSQIAANALQKMMEGLGQHDLVLFLLSGGGSSLAECPADPSVSQADLHELHRLLVTAGANIVDINIVRKHFSGIKGGRLAAAAVPARQITIYISDVPAADPTAVASGPSMPDKSTVDQVLLILQRMKLTEQLPASLRRLLQQGLDETLKPGDIAFARSSWHCLLNNDTAIDVLSQRAKALGWIVEVNTDVDDWPVADGVNTLLTQLNKLAARHPGQTTCLISGGELSCPVTGNGVGGRNQAFVLHAVPQIAGTDISILSAGTDGIDGNSPAAGAFADGSTLQRAMAAGLSATEYEQCSDAYTFFDRLSDVIVTGPTGNNVRDLRLLVYNPSTELPNRPAY